MLDQRRHCLVLRLRPDVPRQDGSEDRQVTQYPIPVMKPGWPVGTLDLEIDQDDNSGSA